MMEVVFRALSGYHGTEGIDLLMLSKVSKLHFYNVIPFLRKLGKFLSERSNFGFSSDYDCCAVLIYRICTFPSSCFLLRQMFTGMVNGILSISVLTCFKERGDFQNGGEIWLGCLTVFLVYIADYRIC